MNAFLTLLKAILPLVERLLIYLKGVKDGRDDMEAEANEQTLKNAAKAKRIHESDISPDDVKQLRDKYSRK